MRAGLVVLVAVAAVAAVLVSAPADARPAPDQRAALLGRLSIPAIGVDAGIVPVGVTRAGQLAVGGSVRDVYRWRDGVLPGQPGLGRGDPVRLGFDPAAVHAFDAEGRRLPDA